MKNQIFKYLLFFCLLIFFSCQKTEVQEEPSGIITVDIEGTKYNFNITRILGYKLNRGACVFEAVNHEREEAIVFGLFHDTNSTNGQLKDFFDPQFKLDITQSRPSFILINKKGYNFDMETAKITITNADFASKTIEGTFSSEAIEQISRRNIKLENGYFKIKMPAWLYQN